MVGLRNSLHRRNHKERAQLVGRKKLGLLEKHKDYVQRAKDYHSKQDRIKRLKVKAAERNKDEFYFSMKSSKTKRGVHVASRGNAALPTDMVKVLKSQDANYIRTVRNNGRKKIEAIRTELTSMADLVKPEISGAEIPINDEAGDLDEEELETLREAGILASSSSSNRRHKVSRKAPRHLVFFENDDEARLYQTPTSHLSSSLSKISTEETPVDLGWVNEDTTPGGKGKGKAKVDEDRSQDEAEELRSQASKHRSSLLKELTARLKRDTLLRYAERELEMQKLLMGKGANEKIRDREKILTDKAAEEDEEDYRPRKRKQKDRLEEPTAYKPKVYKWKQVRKT